MLVTALMGAASLLFLASDADAGPYHPMLLPLVHGVLAGVGGAFSTADLFNLYVWFEVMLICALGLFAIGGRLDQLDASFKYLVLNLVEAGEQAGALENLLDKIDGAEPSPDWMYDTPEKAALAAEVGYLITLILVSEIDRGQFSFLSFYERRARRLLPALFGFNVGVEVGQLVLVAALWPLLRDLSRVREGRPHRLVVEVGSALLCSVGLFWFLTRAFE